MTFSAPDMDFSGLPLASLPAISFDTETTGLDVANARIVQIGAVRLNPGDVGDDDKFDMLVNPGIPIPSDSTKIHNIADADVSGAADFAAAIGSFAEWAGTPIILGWSIGFDLAILKAEHDRHKLAWQPPRSFDVRHLVQLLSPNLPGLSLEIAAAWLGIEVKNRHNALGDALLTAQIFRALVPRLRENGIVTLAQAERACRSQTQLLEEEARAGWHEVAVASPVAPASVHEYARIDSHLYRHRVGDIMETPPVLIAPDSLLKDVLATMMQKRVSSVFLPPDEAGGVHGIITERDILRAIDSDNAAALATPASDYATRPLISVEQAEFIYRAIGIMSARDIRHLGVRDSTGTIVGGLNARDLLQQRGGDAVSLGDSIEAAATPAELGQIWPALTTVVRGLMREDVNPADIAAVISRELRALTRRACEIAEREMTESGQGPPPSPYAMLVLGSGGRGESLLAMDQDNAIIFAAGEPGGIADKWFAHLGQRVADILNEVGVVYCAGGVMGANAGWRMDVAGWRKTVGGWIRRTQPTDILNADIFFDAVPVHGAPALGESLHEEALEAARGSRTFLQSLSMNAADFKIPLGLFGRFQAKDGRVDLKKGGIMPIFSTARVIALRYGIAARSTAGRFEAAREHLKNSGAAIDNLMEAHGILLDAILHQQLIDMETGTALSNRVAPDTLTAHDRQQLRWALEQIPSVADLLGTPLLG